MHEELIAKYNALKSKEISIDITRGKPDKDQLDLSNDLIDNFNTHIFREWC